MPFEFGAKIQVSEFAKLDRHSFEQEILAPKEAEIRKIVVRSQPGQIVQETLS
jgi:hypothetical protein